MNPSLARALPIVLVVSLALNLFLAGAIASHLLHRGPDHGAMERPHRHGLLPHPRQLRHALSPEAQARFDALHEAHRPRIRERLRAVGAARRALGEVLRAEPLDRARMDAAFAALREEEGRLAAETQSMFGTLALELSPEDRARLAEMIPGPRRRHSRD